jgi:hypothetical protein
LSEILQDRLNNAPWMMPRAMRLPGTEPADPARWLQRDSAFAAQMALRDELIATKPADVHQIATGCEPAARELLALILTHLDGVPGYEREGAMMRRLGGIAIPLDGGPLIAAGRLVQEDLLILQKPEGAAEHVLTGAILCFPSNWTLAEKFGLPLGRIHLPVERYDANIARRVQRLMDHLRAGVPLMRYNLGLHNTAGLYLPLREGDAREAPPAKPRYIRVERQTLLRLPATRAIVFSIHTAIVRREALTPEQASGLKAMRPA